MEYKTYWMNHLFSPPNSSVSLNHSYLDPKCLHKKATSLLINWTCAVSGQWDDLQEVATAMPLFCLCLQNIPVANARAKAQAVHRPLWVLGHRVGLEHGWRGSQSSPCALYSWSACIPQRGVIYPVTDLSRPHCFSCLQPICVGQHQNLMEAN